MSTTMTETPTSDRKLRYLADSYEQAQRIRIETGERIRAVLQSRDETWTVEADWEVPAEWMTQEEYESVIAMETITPEEIKALKKKMSAQVDTVLRDISVGRNLGPVAILGRTYHRHALEERELYKEMESILHAHVTWPWLDEVRGIGPTLACKILARLDPRLAPHASSFWSYCGLATVPAERYQCETCKLDRSWPVGYNVKTKHKALGSTKNCAGQLVLTQGPDDGVRCAQPKASRGEKRSYDAYAKKIMYLIGTGFLKAGGPYERHYRAARARLEVERIGWPDGRKHYTALRVVEKLFLSHLWQVWRTELGMEVGEPYSIGEMGHEAQAKIEPWDMVGK